MEGEYLRPRILHGISPLFSEPILVDAAAKVDDDEMLYDGGGAWAAVELREEEDEEERGMRKDRGVLIYKGISQQAGTKIEEEPNNGYPTTRTP